LTLIKIGNRSDLIKHQAKSYLFDMHGLGSAKPTRKLLNAMRTVNPDIIHLHNIHGYYINYPVLFNFIARENVPLIWTFHDCWPITGHCCYFSDIDCIKWKSECHNCPKKHSYPSSLLFDRSRANFRKKKKAFNSPGNLTIVPVSTWLENIIQESFLAKYPIRVISNGIDLDLFKPADDTYPIKRKIGVYGRHLLLAVASKWDRRKNLDDYLRLRAVLPQDYVIVLVGLDLNTIEKLPPGVVGLERTESVEELKDIYSAADIVLNLSTLESFGLTTVEGFACGTPGIVYNATASPELISPETGFIVETGNIDQLADAVKKMIYRGKEHYAKACRERAELLYDKEKRFNDYLNLYTEILSR
ncbi:MAG TPA: glycosyltransferase, partial [Bacteroidales bacterium]|nr:glycosyltransferase [Bacteroidales bacterium]